MVNHLLHGIIIIDQLGIILKVNNAASELFGYHLDELIGRNIMIIPSYGSIKLYLSLVV